MLEVISACIWNQVRAIKEDFASYPTIESTIFKNVVERLSITNHYITLHAIRELHKHGVHVIFEQESLDSSNADHTLLISIISAIAEEENENRRKNVNWGMERRLENGTSRLYTRPCYGYTRDTCGELVINEQQADVVKMCTLFI